MSRRAIIRRPAQRDIDGHADYIGARDPQAGLRFYDAVQHAVKLLTDMPELGALYQHPNPRLAGMRYWTVREFENYVVFYRTTPDGIEVVRVLHAAQDADAIFGH